MGKLAAEGRLMRCPLWVMRTLNEHKRQRRVNLVTAYAEKKLAAEGRLMRASSAPSGHLPQRGRLASSGAARHLPQRGRLVLIFGEGDVFLHEGVDRGLAFEGRLAHQLVDQFVHHQR